MTKRTAKGGATDGRLRRLHAAEVLETISRGEQPDSAAVYEAAGELREWSWTYGRREIIDAAEALERISRDGRLPPLDPPARAWAARAATVIRAAVAADHESESR